MTPVLIPTNTYAPDDPAMGGPAHRFNPKSTARRGVRRLIPAVQAHVPPALKRPDALEAIRLGLVDPASATVVWLVNNKPVVMSVGQFVVPDLCDLQRVRRIGSHEGAQSRTGWYPVRRGLESLNLEAESRTEMHWLRVLDCEAGVSFFHTQPFVIFWPVLEERVIVRYPDIVAIKDGVPMVVEVKPEERMNDYSRAIFTLTRDALASAGVGFRHVGSPSQQSVVNHMAVTRHKRPNPALIEFVWLLLDVRPFTCYHAQTLCGDRAVAAEVLCYLRANHMCWFDLDQRLRDVTRIHWPAEAAV